MRKIKFIITLFFVVCLIGCGGEKKEKKQATVQVQQQKVSQTKTQERKFITGKTVQMVTEAFAELDKPTELIFFTQEIECRFCADTRQLLTEIASFSDKVDLVVYDFVKDKQIAEKYGVDKIPATVIKTKNGTDKGIKFYGIPGGYEFGTFLESVKLVSTGEHGFSDDLIAKIKEIKEPVHLQVIVTPT